MAADDKQNVKRSRRRSAGAGRSRSGQPSGKAAPEAKYPDEYPTTGGVAGFVLDLEKAAGLADASVALARVADGPDERFDTTDSDGRFGFDDVALGPYAVRLKPVPDGFEFHPPDVNLRQVAVDEDELEVINPFLLRPVTATGTLEGSVRNVDDAAPVAGIQVALEPVGGGDPTLVESGDDGSFTRAGLAPGDYAVGLRRVPALVAGRSWQPRPPDKGERNGTVSPGMIARVAPILVEPLPVVAVVTGRVLDATNGSALVGVQVALQAAGAGAVLRVAETGEGGMFSFDEVAAGSYEVAPAHHPVLVNDDQPFEPVVADPNAGKRTVEVASAAPVTVPPILLEPQRHRIFGRVRTRPGGPGVPFALVRILDERGNQLATVKSDRDGDYEFRTDAPGRYLVEVVPDTIRQVEAVEVESDQRLDPILPDRADGPGEPFPATQGGTGVPGAGDPREPTAGKGWPANSGDAGTGEAGTFRNAAAFQEAADRGSDVAARLRWVRERGLGAMEEARGDLADVDWRARLLPAAHQLREALEALTHEDDIWRALRASSVAPRDALVLQQVFDQDLAALLVFMGYRPPPPPQRLEVELKEALATALEAPPGAAVVATGRAQQHLSLFLLRLRRVIAEAEAAAPAPLADEQRLRARLADALRKGMLVAVPAALAAGAVGLAFPAAAPAAAAAGLGAAVTPAGQELLKQAIQLAATSLLDKTLAGEPADASPKERLAAAWPRTRRALYDLQVALVNLDRNPTPDLFRWVDALGIDGASSLYGLLQAGAEITPASQSYALEATAGRLVDLVHQARNQVTAPSVPKDASRISQNLAEETRKLEAVMGGWV